MEEERNKMSEDFILKASKSFRMSVDTVIEKKNGGHLNKFTVLCLSYIAVVVF